MTPTIQITKIHGIDTFSQSDILWPNGIESANVGMAGLEVAASAKISPADKAV
jgi:hypothetical protein